MNTIRNRIVLSIFALLLAGCGGSPGPVVLPGQNAADAQATINAWNVREQATSAAVAQQTAAAAQVTAEHEAVIRATEGAAAAAIATATTAAESTQSALAVQATSAAQVASATWDALLVQQQQIAIQATATADAAALAFQEAQAAKALAARQAEIDRVTMWNRMMPWIVGLVSLTAAAGILAIVGVMLIERLRRTRPMQAGDVWVMVGADGHPMALNRPPQIAANLPPASITSSRSLLSASVDSEPSWRHFTGWNNRKRVLLGMEGGNKPITLDTQASPHLFIAGSSRRGKTSGGLVPYITWALAAGMNVVLLGERAADFAAFNDHPNATNLRAFSDEERVNLTQAALEAARREMERRDQVLHTAGLNTWHDLMQHEPGEAGPLLIVVDEFLALATLGGSAVHRSMMQDVASLTSQAGKFGIGLVLAATDPRREALGAMGYLAVKQCTRMVFGFNDRGSSRSVLSDDAAFNLPTGSFIYESVAGGRQRGVAFRPSGDEVRALLSARPVDKRDLPETLRGIAPSIDVAVDIWGAADEGPPIVRPTPRHERDPLLYGMQTSRGFVSPSEVERVLDGARMGLPHYRIEQHAFGKQGGAHYYMAEAVLCYFGVSASTVSTAEVER